MRLLDEVAKVICCTPVGIHRGAAPCEACYVRAEALLAAKTENLHALPLDGGLILLMGSR
jgi:hypothetical protein